MDSGKIVDSTLITSRKQEVTAYLLLILTSIIWGGTWPLGRWLVSEEVGGATIPPFMIAIIRYFLAVICFILILKFKEGRLNWQFAKEHWKILALMGMLSVTIYQTGYLVGELLTSASDASIMVATNAIWVVILSSAFLKTERFAWNKMIGSLLAFIAVIIVVGFSPNVDVSNRILGDIMVLLGAFGYATYTVLSRFFFSKTSENTESYQPSSLWLMTWVSMFGFLITTPIAFVLSPEFLIPTTYLTIPPRVWIGISYLAFISTIGAYTFYLEGVKRLSASRAAIFQTLVPLFGVLFSAIFLQELFDILVYPFALVCVILGIILVNLNSHKTVSKEYPWFKGMNFIVTGGSSGIGLAISKLLSKEDARVIAVSYNEEEFMLAKTELGEYQKNVEFFRCDITNSEDRQSLIEKLKPYSQSLAGLINVAGITTYGPFFKTPPQAIDRMLNINFTGTILFIREIFPLILENSISTIKYLGFVSSTSGGAPFVYIGGYPGTKAGVEMFLRSLRLEMPEDVKIVTIRPGPVSTNLYNNAVIAPGSNITALFKFEKKMFISPEEVAIPLIQAIKKRKQGIIYPNFTTKLLVKLMSGRFLGKAITKRAAMYMMEE